MLYKNAAKQIKLLRIQNGLTQGQLAKAIGVTEKYISIVENNYRKPSLVFYRDVANYFKVSFDFLFIDSSQNKRNVYIDSVNVRMNYMNESDQKMVLKFVEDFSDYILEREKDKE